MFTVYPNTKSNISLRPAYFGKSATDLTVFTEAALSSFTKTFSSNITSEVVLNNEYAFFLLFSDNHLIQDNNLNFNFKIGGFNDDTVFIQKKLVTVTLNSGATVNMWYFRTRQKRTQTLNLSVK